MASTSVPSDAAGAPVRERPLRQPITRAQTFINGLGCHHPERRVTNADLTLRMDTSDEWILDHTGIRERRYAEDDVDTSDLGVLALRSALADAGAKPEDLDLLVCATSTPDLLIPSTACYIANKMALRATAFDVNAACSGFVYGLAVAQGLMHSQRHDRVALCTAEKYTRVIDPEDRANSIFWGDAAGAVVLQRERPTVGIEVVDVTLSAHNQGADLVRIPIGGNFEMHGRAVKKIAFQGMVDSATETLERHQLAPADLRGFVSHQANLRMIEGLSERLGIAEDRHWHNVEMFGNQGAAGVLTSFCAGLQRNADDLRDGDLFLLTVYGAGFTGGSALLRWVATPPPPDAP
jgi:3-oxoacyl-[acyl-carrier-protein] synthase-3